MCNQPFALESILRRETAVQGQTAATSCCCEKRLFDNTTLPKNLKIEKADFFGFSNGGTTTLQIAIRHPEIVDKIILGSALSKRNGVPEQFLEFMKQVKMEMPELLREAYMRVSSDTNRLQIMFAKDAKRMVDFKDISDDKTKSIK